MVGSGFYLSPAAVAPFGNLAILVWIVMGAGAISLGLTLAKAGAIGTGNQDHNASAVRIGLHRYGSPGTSTERDDI